MQCFRQMIVFTLLVTAHCIAYAQSPNQLPLKRCSVKTINFEDGLLDNATHNIFTDALGFTWISTAIGIQRFNGNRLETIIPIVNKKEIDINYPVIFFGLQNGNMWITYKEGILNYDPFTSSFRTVISYPRSVNSYLPLVPMQQTKEGIWCMQEKKGVVIYSIDGILKKTMPFFDTAYPDSIVLGPELLYNSLSTGNDKFIFIQNFRTRILKINTTTHQFTYVKTDGTRIYGLACDDQHLFLLTAHGVSSMDINTGEMIRTTALKTFAIESISSGAIALAYNQQVLVSVNNRLFEFDTSGICRKEFTTLDRGPVMATGGIVFTYADKFKRIWLLTNDDIKRIQNVNVPFDHFLYPEEKNNFVRSLYYDEQKHILLAGCYNGSIQLYDTSANLIWKKPVSIPDVNYILTIEKLGNDNYLLETLNKGWYILDLAKRQTRPFPMSRTIASQLGFPSANFLNNVQRINDSTIFSATAANVYRCVFRNTQIVSAQPLLPIARHTDYMIGSFLYSSDKTLWAGTTSGILMMLGKDGTLRNINIPGNYIIRCIAEDAKHHIWIGTEKGLYVYSPAGELIRKVTRSTGLLNDCIYALLPVDSAAVFASSNLGLSYISAEGAVTNYSKEQGLQGNEFNTGAAIRTSSGKFYFGGVNGINAFYPVALNAIVDTPIINITRLVVNDSLYNTSASFWKGDSIFLQHYQNHLEIDFAAMGLLNINEYLYRYRLTGFENAWQSTNQPTGIKYILEPGPYTLEISVNPILSSNSVFTKKITIIIYPPWWQALWFRIFIIILAVGIIAFIVQQYNKRKYRQKINALQLEHQIQLERERISRDLHDSLGVYAASIAANIEHISLAETGDESEKALKQLQNNSQSIVSQLGDTIWALKKDELSLTAISDRIKVFIQKIQLSYPDIVIDLSETIKIDPVLPPTQAFHLLQIVQEAIINAVRHSQCKYVNIFVEGDEQWRIIIEDNGKGMPQKGSVSMKGNGIANMELRANEAGWKIDWQQNIGGGTRVVIVSRW